jgi:hypothetical protein
MRSRHALALAGLAFGCSRATPEPLGTTSSASVSAPVGAASTASIAADGLDVPRNTLCPGPCRWVFDRGADGFIDAAATLTYHPDGRAASAAIDRDGDGSADRTFLFRYRRHASGDLPEIGDKGAWGGVVLDTVTLVGLDQPGPPIRTPYWRGLLFHVPDAAPYKEVGTEGLDRNGPLAYEEEKGRPGEPGCEVLSESTLDAATRKVLLRREFRCDKGLLTGVDVLRERGVLLATVRYDYSCWSSEKGCPATPAVPRALPPPTRVEACRADVRAAAHALDPKQARQEKGEHGLVVLPTRTDDGQRAMRLAGVRQDTALGRLGVRNGDVLVSFGGVKWGSDGALPIAATGVDARESFDIEVERAADPVTIHVRTTDACTPQAR